MFVETSELKTHLFDETIEAVSGGDETIMTAAIKGAISETKGYLSKYDKDAIFAKTADDRDDLLLIFVKDIAVWHFIALCNPGVEYATRENRYKAAIAWLKGVQRGDIVPDLPKPTTEGETVDTTYLISSNPKRTQHV